MRMNQVRDQGIGSQCAQEHFSAPQLEAPSPQVEGSRGSSRLLEAPRGRSSRAPRGLLEGSSRAPRGTLENIKKLLKGSCRLRGAIKLSAAVLEELSASPALLRGVLEPFPAVLEGLATFPGFLEGVLEPFPAVLEGFAMFPAFPEGF